MSAYFEEVKRGNALRMHEFAASHPAAVSKTVHATFQLVLEHLANCCTPASLPEGSVHFDLIPASCEEGVFSYLSSFNGVVEPQVRTTEHMHAFYSVLGYTTPEEFFRDGTFVDTFRRLWSFCASVCVVSQEALARRCLAGDGIGMKVHRSNNFSAGFYFSSDVS